MQLSLDSNSDRLDSIWPLEVGGDDESATMGLATAATPHGPSLCLALRAQGAKERYESAIVYWISQEWGISLGWYIFLNPNLHNKTTVKHEYGHSIQSQRLGPLYLFVVGLPSITMNTLSMILYRAGKPAFARNYYNRWPESWADTLGGVKR